MNIFFLSRNISECAYLHHNKHVVKMCLEYTQILSTCHRILDGEQTTYLSKDNKVKKHWKLPDSRESILYKVSHQSHPSNLWVRQTSDNYKFLYSLLKELCTEYRIRYGKGIIKNQVIDKFHSVENLLPYLKHTPYNITEGEFIPPCKKYQAMPDIYKHDDFVTAYRNYYVAEKKLKYCLKFCTTENNKFKLNTYDYSVPSILREHKFVEK